MQTTQQDPMDLARGQRQTEAVEAMMRSVSKAQKDANLRKRFGHEILMIAEPCRRCAYDMRLLDSRTCAYCGAFN